MHAHGMHASLTRATLASVLRGHDERTCRRFLGRSEWGCAQATSA